MLRLGLVGIGDAGRHHAKALVATGAEGLARWAAFASRDAGRRAAFRRELSVPDEVQDFDSLEAMLASRRVDAVILATPDGAHAQQVEHAAAARVHVLVEKPLALTQADAARALHAAERAGTCLAVGYHLRHHAAHREARARLSEWVGPLRSISVRWAWPDPASDGWRARGEGARFWSLAALGTHAIDLAMFFGGATQLGEVASVRTPSTGADRAASVAFFVGEALVQVSVAVTHRAMSRLLITGDAGELEALGTLGARGDGELVARTPRGVATPIAFTAENPYLAQLRAFITAAPRGFVADPSQLANLAILDAIS